MNSIQIEYRFQLDDGTTKAFRYLLHPETFDLISKPVADPPQWTALDFKQCPRCPLDPETHPRCPVALQLHALVAKFEGTKSIDSIKLMVVTPERRVAQRLDIQHGIASLLDLVFPTCGCPKTAYLKPLARFHLPLASEEEHVFRITGMYLLAQYFLGNHEPGGRPSFAGLAELYTNLHEINSCMAGRLQSATSSDSVKNAVALIDVYSMLVPLLIEDQLAEMRGFFAAYLPEQSTTTDTSYFAEAKSFLIDSEEVEEVPNWLKSVAAIKQPPPEAPRRERRHRDPEQAERRVEQAEARRERRHRDSEQAEHRVEHEAPTPPPDHEQTLERILSRSTLTLEPMEERPDDDEEEEPALQPPPLFNRFGGASDD